MTSSFRLCLPPLLATELGKILFRCLKYVHTYMPIGGPHGGAPKALRGAVTGDRMGLEAFLTVNQGLAFGRSFGSTAWLIPSCIPEQAPLSTCVYLRKEAAFEIRVRCAVNVTQFLQGRIESDQPKTLRLSLKYCDEREVYTANSPVDVDLATGAMTVSLDDTFVFAVHPHGPRSSKHCQDCKHCNTCCCLCCVVCCRCCVCCTNQTLLVCLCEPGLQAARKDHVLSSISWTNMMQQTHRAWFSRTTHK